MTSSAEVPTVFPVDGEPRYVALAPAGDRLYAGLTGGDTDAVAVLDARTGAVTATIAVGTLLRGLAVAPDGRRLYVANRQPSTANGVVTVIDTDAGTVLDTVAVCGLGTSPSGIAITPDGAQVWVATGHELAEPADRGTVSVLDTATGTVTDRIPGSSFPSTLTVTPAGDTVHVLDDDGTPQAIDTATHEVRFPLAGLVSNGRLAFTPDGTVAYAVSEGSDLVQVLAVPGFRTVAVVDVFGGHSTDVAVTPDGRFAVVTQRPGNALRRPLWVIDTATHAVVGSAATWAGTADALALAGATAYVADARSRAIRVLPVGQT